VAVNLEQFLDYSSRLESNATRDPNVLGLVLVGSTADTSRVDEWSDHDFFWVVKPGTGEQYRQDLSWIPDISEAVLWPRETDHGLKVVFTDGRVLEFAVFEDSELELSSLNAYEVAVDKADILDRCKIIAARSADKKPVEWHREFELFLATILLGVGRARRGETLTAGQFIRSYSLNHLIPLIRLAQTPITGSESREDNLNGFRRLEQQYPNLAEQIELACQMNVEEAGRALLEIACGLKELTSTEKAQVNVLVTRFDWQLSL
jgi:hypothetical protein